MKINQATAIRKDKNIEVTIFADLPDTCRRAKITDRYPGGERRYPVDPKEAQVFITETSEIDRSICMQVLVPWIDIILIEDEEHEKVSIYINEKKELTIEVKSEIQYSVYEIKRGTSPSHPDKTACVILPDFGEGELPLSRVFGPDNYKACAEWIMQNEGGYALAGGGSGNPKGL